QEFIRGADSYDAGGGPVPLTLSPVTTLRGGAGFITNQDDENTQYSLKLTQLFGNHEFKYGVQFDDISYREAPTYTGPSFNVGLPVSNTSGDPVDANGDGTQDFISLPTQGGALVDVRNTVGSDPTVAYDSANRFRVIRASVGPTPPATKAQELNLFLQDTWRIHPRFSIKAGLRWTQATIEGAGSFTLPFGTQVIDYFGFDYRIYEAGTSTYSPDGYTFAGNWAPRLGLVWDFLGNGRSRAWLNFARYFERVPNDLAVRIFSNEIGISMQDFTDRDLTTPRTSGSTTCDDGAGGTNTCSPSGSVFTQGIDPTNVVGGTKLPYEDELSAGFAFEVTPDSSLEVRAIYRNQGRALEDVQINAVEQIQNFYYGYAYGYPYDPFGGSPSTPISTTYPAALFGSYEMGNPGTSNVPDGGTFDFPEPIRKYKALEVIFTKRFSDDWSLFANYRLARLEGNYEGLYRNDNFQDDPNITSLYDFPNSPLMSGQFESGLLPTDVTHVLRVFPSYVFSNKLRAGANLTWASGVPRTSLLAHPIYMNSGEIPGIDPIYAYWADDGGGGLEIRNTSDLSTAYVDPDAAYPGYVFLQSYTPVERGNLGRTPDTLTLDLHADYPISLGNGKLSFFVDVFNVFNRRQVLSYIDTVELRAAVTDPDYLRPASYQNPRSWRLGTRWSF
ncbi:MAG: TonB-dependent receptor domain-containing protein, partial [Planctomycetota bacterium]